MDNIKMICTVHSEYESKYYFEIGTWIIEMRIQDDPYLCKYELHNTETYKVVSLSAFAVKKRLAHWGIIPTELLFHKDAMLRKLGQELLEK